MSLIKMITREEGNFNLDFDDVVVKNWSKPTSFELREKVLLLDLQTRTSPNGLHYHSIANRSLEVQEGIQPFLRSDGVVIAYLSPKSNLKVYRADDEIITGNDSILKEIGLGVSWGGLQKYECTPMVDREAVTGYVDLVKESDCYIEKRDPNFDSETKLIKRGEYGSVCGSVFKGFENSGKGTILILPRPENLAIRPETWFNQTMSVAYPYLPNDVQEVLRPEEESQEEEKQLRDPVQQIIRTFGRFHKVAKQLEQRHNDRDTLLINDEHDVQDLVHSLLWLEFDDVRDEEHSPSHGGSASRIDFLVKNERIGIEIKYTDGNKGSKDFKTEIAEDKEHYQAHPDCEKLICFIYDPELALENPTGFENDLSNPDGPLSTSVVVFPK